MIDWQHIGGMCGMIRPRRGVEALSREQAHSELFFYSVLLATCFLVLTVISLAGKLPFGPSVVARCTALQLSPPPPFWR